jgi:hypothetical protein
MRLYVSPLLFALLTALVIPISASAQTDAECVAVYDSVGTRVARASIHPGGGLSIDAYAFFEDDGILAPLAVYRDVLHGSTAVYFTGTNCTGDAYMLRPESIQTEAHLGGNVVWYPDTAATSAGVTVGYQKLAGTDSCSANNTFLSDAVPAYTFTLPTFTPPFHLESEACYTPSPAVAALTPYGLGAMALVLAFGSYIMVRRPRAA